jgi:hypothetical protein
VLWHRNGESASDTGTGLLGFEIAYAVQARNATHPKVAIEWDPKPPVREIATQVSFKGADRCFGLRLGNGNVEERMLAV